MNSKTFLGVFGLSLLVAAGTFACETTVTDTPNPDGGVTPGTDAGPDGAIDPATCPATGSAAVTVDVTGLPAGVNPKISATGSSGAQDVSTGGTLTAGVYTIAASTVTVADPRVRTAYKATLSSASSVCVKDGQPVKVTVTYALIPTSNKLWELNANAPTAGANQLLGFASADIATMGSADGPTAVGLDLPTGIAFDKDGGMWAAVAIGGAQTLSHYTAGSLATGGTKTPDVTINSTALNGGAPATSGIAFDPNGNLWATAPAANKILRFDAAKLTVSGTVEPTVFVGGDSTNLDTPSAIAFDASGNLWACDNGHNRVVEYSAAHLGTTTAAADVAITVTALIGPRGLAFDGANNLWVNFDRTFVRLTGTDRAATGTPTPSVVITVDPLALPENLMFDESGSLWFAYSQGKFGRLSSTQLTNSTAPGDSRTPDVVIASTAVGSITDVAIYPAPANTPMFSRLP